MSRKIKFVRMSKLSQNSDFVFRKKYKQPWKNLKIKYTFNIQYKTVFVKRDIDRQIDGQTDIHTDRYTEI